MLTAIFLTMAWLLPVVSCQKEATIATKALAEDANIAVKDEVAEQAILPWPWPPKNPCLGIICLNACYMCVVLNGFPVCVPKIKCPPCFSMVECKSDLKSECYCKPDCRAVPSTGVKCGCPSCQVCSPVTGTCVPKICPLCQHCDPATGNCSYIYETASSPAKEFVTRIAQLPQTDIEQGTFTAGPLICPLATVLPLPCPPGCTCRRWGVYIKNGHTYFSCLDCGCLPVD